jgi:hypothetical protein
MIERRVALFAHLHVNKEAAPDTVSKIGRRNLIG